MDTIKYVIFGILMGVANVIPGVSGGTIGVIFNFYDQLIESITLNFKVIKKNLPFLIPLGIGVVIGIVGLSSIIQYLLVNYTMQTCFAFIGIIVGSIPLIYKNATEDGFKPTSLIPFAIALGIMLALYFIAPNEMSTIVYKTLTIESFFVITICMAIATITMILPGISGSLILVILGMYSTIYGYAIGERVIPLLIPVGVGGVVGLLGGAKVVAYLLNHFKQPTYFAILGLVIGSIINIYPGFSFDVQGISAIIIMIVAFIIIYWFGRQEN